MDQHLPGLPESVVPRVTWEQKTPLDLLGALESLSQVKVEARIIREPGRGVDATLGWARSELELAKQSSPDDSTRHACQATVHAQCAVECLIDTYLERDWLNEQLPCRARLANKITLISKRPVLKLPECLWSKIIREPRNDIIHRYANITVHDATMAVQAAWAIVDSLRARSDPCHGKVIAGSLLGGTSSSDTYRYSWFGGFWGAFGLTWRGSDGIVRVASGKARSSSEAEIWWAEIKSFSVDEHLQLLSWWDSVKISGAEIEDELRERMQKAGLDSPSSTV